MQAGKSSQLDNGGEVDYVESYKQGNRGKTLNSDDDEDVGPLNKWKVKPH